MVAILETLREEHHNTARLLLALEHQIEVFAFGGSPDYDIVTGVADYLLDFASQCHHPKEDAVAARLLAAHPHHAPSLSDLFADHRHLHERASRFRDTLQAMLRQSDIPRAAIVDAARHFIDAEWAHMRMEEAQFFPLAETLLTPEDWTEIEAALGRRRDPLSGERVEASFQRLRERLLAWEAESRDQAAGIPVEI